MQSLSTLLKEICEIDNVAQSKSKEKASEVVQCVGKEYSVHNKEYEFPRYYLKDNYRHFYQPNSEFFIQKCWNEMI